MSQHDLLVDVLGPDAGPSAVADDAHLTTPLALATLVGKMAAGGDSTAVISLSEASALQEEVNRAKQAAQLARDQDHPVSSSGWTPKGEGPSGLASAPTVVATSKSTYEDDTDLPDHISDPESCVHQDEGDDLPREPRSDGSGVMVSSGVPIIEYVTREEYSILVEGVDAVIQNNLTEKLAPIHQAMETLRQELRTYQRTITDLSVRMSDLSLTVSNRTQSVTLEGERVEMEGDRRTGTRTDPVDLVHQGVTEGGHKGKGKEKEQTVPGPSHTSSASQITTHTRTPSIRDVPGVSTQVGIVEEFLNNNPNRPGLLAVRKVKLSQLASKLGFRPGGTDVSLQMWNVDGVLQALTADLK